MARRTVDLGGGRPLLDVGAYARSAGRSLTTRDREIIARTVARVPEVMVKVSGGATSLGGVQAHLAYISRDGELGIETDQGTRVTGKGSEKYLALDWDLDLDAHGLQNARTIRGTRRPSKLVHNIVFSMPPGTPTKKVISAVRAFAIDEFALQHRYALVLHTDESHPHVHLVVKAVSEQGVRLNIRKATLRRWRDRFAHELRQQGVAANATERVARGLQKSARTSRVNGVLQRTFVGAQHHLAHGRSERQLQTRSEVINGWRKVISYLEDEGSYAFAKRVQQFLVQSRSQSSAQPLSSRNRLSPNRDLEIDRTI